MDINNLLVYLPTSRLRLPPSSLIIEKPKFEDAIDNEVFGSSHISDFTESNDWRPFYPKHEIQSYGDCVSFSYNNSNETVAKKNGITDLDGNELNLSDLELAFGSGTTKTGNSLNRVAERGRKIGVPLEKHCPYTRNWNKRAERFASVPKEAHRYLIGTGHTWVRTDVKSLKNALGRVPVQIGVGLGSTYRRGGVIEPPDRVLVWHAIILGHIDEENQYHTFDHYNRKEVIFSSDYKISFAKAIYPEGLPSDWRMKHANEIKLYNRLRGHIIIRPEANGEAYRVHSTYLKKVIFNVSDSILFGAVQDCLAKKNVFVGVSEADFEKLKKAIELMKGYIDENAGEVIDLEKLLTA